MVYIVCIRRKPQLYIYEMSVLQNDSHYKYDRTCILSQRFCRCASLLVRAWCRAFSCRMSFSLCPPPSKSSSSSSDAESDDSASSITSACLKQTKFALFAILYSIHRVTYRWHKYETFTSFSVKESCLFLVSTDWLFEAEVATEMYFPPLKASRGSSCPHKASRKYFSTVTLLQSAAIAWGREIGRHVNTGSALTKQMESIFFKIHPDYWK